ncbi:MAG: hypothetical protein M3432_07220 [Chloroflexota bacterium]|nr:hypothetical protein [Chloroflexota bacterium]
MRVPTFLVRRFYVAGSLRNTPTGFRLQAHNDMGEGTLVGVTRIAVDGVVMDPAGITAQRDGSDEVVRAVDISRTSPVPVRRGERVTLHVTAQPLAVGRHDLEVDLVELNLGALQLAITESVEDDGGAPRDEPGGAPRDEAGGAPLKTPSG